MLPEVNRLLPFEHLLAGDAPTSESTPAARGETVFGFDRNEASSSLPQRPQGGPVIPLTADAPPVREEQDHSIDDAAWHQNMLDALQYAPAKTQLRTTIQRVWLNDVSQHLDPQTRLPRSVPDYLQWLKCTLAVFVDRFKVQQDFRAAEYFRANSPAIPKAPGVASCLEIRELRGLERGLLKCLIEGEIGRVSRAAKPVGQRMREIENAFEANPLAGPEDATKALELLGQFQECRTPGDVRGGRMRLEWEDDTSKFVLHMAGILETAFTAETGHDFFDEELQHSVLTEEFAWARAMLLGEWQHSAGASGPG